MFEVPQKSHINERQHRDDLPDERTEPKKRNDSACNQQPRHDHYRDDALLLAYRITLTFLFLWSRNGGARYWLGRCLGAFCKGFRKQPGKEWSDQRNAQ